jgi:hypothetical protein
MASVVKSLLGQEAAGSEWEDRYVTAIGKAEKFDWDDHSGVEAAATEVLEMLNDKYRT